MWIVRLWAAHEAGPGTGAGMRDDVVACVLCPLSPVHRPHNAEHTGCLCTGCLTIQVMACVPCPLSPESTQRRTYRVFLFIYRVSHNTHDLFPFLKTIIEYAASKIKYY